MSKDKKQKKGGVPSAYILFCNAKRSEYKEKNPDASPKDVMKGLAQLWKDASDDEKAKYQKQHDEEKAKNDEEKKNHPDEEKKSKSKKSKKESESDGDEDEDDDEE